jgi:HAD superfamily phosphoserine phosphatase-like hydrolase
MASEAAHKVAVFDINGTLYRKSSKEEFFKYICFKNGYKLLDIYHVFVYKILGKARLINQTEFKENFFNYLDDLRPEEVRKYAGEYWSIEYPQYFNEELMQRVKELKEEDTQIICISGGLDVYLAPLFELLDVDAYYCTKTLYQNNTYKVDGEACKGVEKLKKLKEHFGEEPYRIVEAYSDEPEEILEEAEKAYIIHPEGRVVTY